ncbi:MAG: putative Zn-dependent protease [Sulfurimonas sp.]|jgi:predicted Zn-dependent protease|uniref:tetratricopeptide repeat protein n=1 Tax=Sulfurimonas sp. TaxID=2022749 RepID=UPI0039E57BA2
MYKILLFTLSIGFLFSGCVTPAPELPKNTLKQAKNKKIFEEEDTLIMFALRTEELGDFKSSSEIFDTLYTRSNRREYLYRSLQNYLYLKENDIVIKRVDYVTQGKLDDFILVRLKIVALIQLGKYDEALALAIGLVEKSNVVDDYILVSDIYTAKKEFSIAVKYLESAYLQDYSEKILDRMSIILYINLQRKKDAIAHLETHTRVHGCSIIICKRLIAIYSNEDNINGLLSAYLRYYKLDSNPDVAKKIVQLYGYTKKYNQLILFLQSSGSDDKTLLQLYLTTKNYTKAFPLAMSLYKETGEVKYLGESVIYEYEMQKDKNNKDFLIKISQKFEDLIDKDSNSSYLNYYGYILIEHDVDVKKGMRYVKRALKLEPSSAYYLDSLAWGYYKLKECKASIDVIEKVLQLDGGNDPEVLNHYKLIKKCKGK